MHLSDDLYERLDRNRIIVINNYIDSNLAQYVISKLLIYSEVDEKQEIQIFFGQSDGNYYDVLAIYDTMMMIPNDICAICLDSIANYSALLVTACTKGKRVALKHTLFSLQQPYAYIQPGVNQQTEIQIMSEETRKQRQVVEELIAKNTNKTFKEIHEACETGISLSSEEAVEFGIIDLVIGGNK